MPSISKLRVLLLRGDSHSIQLKAATEILDRAGIVAEQRVEVDNQVTVRVSYEDVELARSIIDANVVSGPTAISYEALPPAGNGHEKTPHQEGSEERNGDG